tara:strand:+ start:45 stop:536 length:492 start_codon:yes stop_codon:yes gene_type:complete
MNEFDKNWIAYPKNLHDARNESIIITQITRARRIVFIAKGRVGLATKMFMQRLSQIGYKVAHSEDLLVPEIDVHDLAVFVTASGDTLSSLAYIQIAKKCRCKTLAITFNAQGEIPKQCDTVCEYKQPKQKSFMKSYYEVGFIYIFERIISFLPTEQFVHTNFE